MIPFRKRTSMCVTIYSENKLKYVTELVYGSSMSIMARVLASRQGKATSDSRLYVRVVFG